MADTNRSFKRYAKASKDFFKDLFDLQEDQASERETIEEIRRSVPFQGTNLWILIFAIMICSVGLNVNSPAVVIGAMLISPLMGPIMGVGTGVGINDFQLIMKALKNLGIAAGMSVLVSGIYFWLSPLHDAQSELLSRTQPTLWDVLIAFFGGLAGIVAGSRREKSNAIPGVAIATALMPPLCTAGYGLARAEWTFFFGAIYLFFINCVFISFSTFLIVRFLRFPTKEFMNKERETQVKRYIFGFVLLTIIPSIYTGINLVQRSVFERNAQAFIRQELVFDSCRVIQDRIYYDEEPKRIEATLYGKPVSEEVIGFAERKLYLYNLQGTDLDVRQPGNYNNDIDILEAVQKMTREARAEEMDALFKRTQEDIKDRDGKIQLLERELDDLRKQSIPYVDIYEEATFFNRNIRQMSVGPSVISSMDSMKLDTVLLAYIRFKKPPDKEELENLKGWLGKRTKSDRVKLIVE